jgi:limonene 1,2-monooxygenase
MKFGVFIAPFHTLNDNPTLSIRRDIDLIEYCDQLGYDEAWVGEHHSTGVERIADPFLILAAAAGQTSRIKIVADRVVQLDHMTYGRAMLGVGPGALVSDAVMMGIEPAKQRPRMLESLEAILRLLNGDVVTVKHDWFELHEAQLALAPFQETGIPVAVASLTSPSGMVAAGRHGLGVLSLSAGFIGGKKNMKEQWEIAESTAAESGHTMDRSNWRMVVRVHLAEDRDEAVRAIEKGRLDERKNYFKPILGLENDYTLQDEIADDSVLVGTPDDAIAAIERIQDITGGFGTFLIMAHDWASWSKTRSSYELFARYVIPHFQGTLNAPQRSGATIIANRPSYGPLSKAAISKAFADAGREVPEGLDITSLR